MVKPSDVAPQVLYPFDTRLIPSPVPDTGIFDCPAVTICINSKWVSHLDGLLTRLLFADAWDADETEQERAIGEIYKLLAQLKEKNMCCNDTVTNQYVDDNGIIQVSTDGGLTYDPLTNDPRFNSPLLPPLTSEPGEDRRCEAANNVVGMVKDSAEQLIADTQAWANLTGLIAALVALIFLLLEVGSGGALTLVLLPLAAALLAAGQGGLEAALTTDVWQTFLEIVYCNTPDDGTYTQENWIDIQNQVIGRIGGIAQTFIHYSVRGYGTAGLNNASRLGISAGLSCAGIVCHDCPCDLLSWNWGQQFGTPEENNFSRDFDGCAVGGAAWLNPTDGLYYYGVYSPVKCTITSGLNAGGVNIFHGYIDGDDKTPYDWFDPNHDWLPGTININRNARAILMISTTPFSAYSIMS